MRALIFALGTLIQDLWPQLDLPLTALYMIEEAGSAHSRCSVFAGQVMGSSAQLERDIANEGKWVFSSLFLGDLLSLFFVIHLLYTLSVFAKMRQCLSN